MNVLIAALDIFGRLDDRSLLYSRLIVGNPSVQFYFFDDRTRVRVPRNAHKLPLADAYRRNVGEFGLEHLPDESPAAPIGRQAGELALLMDMAAAVPAIHFAIVDIPQSLPLGVYFPECLKYFGIRCDRVALSILHPFSYRGGDDVDSRSEHEPSLYHYADLRYGISRRHVEHWSGSTGLPAQLLDIGSVSAVLPQAPTSSAAPDAAAPDLCFIGSLETWEGADLFLELCSQLPRGAFGRVRLWGAAADSPRDDVMDELRRLARRRSLDIIHEVLSGDEIAARLRSDRLVVVLPSPLDAFNLAALEALFNGCPTVIGTGCGAREFLDAAYPGLPYIGLDPSDVMGSYDAILSLLSDYDVRRRELAGCLANATRNDYGLELPQVYAAASKSDQTARGLIGERFNAFAGWLAGDFHERVADTFAAQVRVECGEVLATNHCATIEPPAAEREFRQAIDVHRLWMEAMAPRSAHGDGWVAIDQARERLNGFVFGGSRIALYRLMAEWERRRGNELLYATYWLRIMRLSGEIPRSILRDVMTILEAGGFDEEARVAEIIRRDDEEEIYRYLTGRADRLHTAPVGDIAASIEFDRPAAARVSVIVSVYCGAPKIETFVAGLERFTDDVKRITEFIFVDSASPDGTHAILTERLRVAATRGIGALYLRSKKRETIQRAWKRGIDASRGLYLAFLGVDEMDRPDALAKMAAFLDRRPDIDWVQGSAVITEVTAAGSYVRDVMAYDRRFDSRHIHYLECCYVSYVGALYRKSVHDRVGFYDDNFRGAGDTEFKNRALPFIEVETLPETLGTFLNYPEERTTQSPTAELEDLRAWYLHRTAGGVRYAFENESDEACIRYFRQALHYKKSYMDGICTDVDYALNIAAYMKRHRPAAFAEIEPFIPNLVGLRQAYQRLDLLVLPGRSSGISAFKGIAEGLQQAWFAIAEAHSIHKLLGLPAEYRIGNDNRWHQHQTLWPSKPSATAIAAEFEMPKAQADRLAAGGNVAAAGEGVERRAAALVAADAALAGRTTGRLAEMARSAVNMILHGDAIAPPALGALCSLATSADAEEMLHALAAEVSAADGQGVNSIDSVMEDVHAVIGSYFGTMDDATVVLSPALPFDVVAQTGEPLPERTEAAQLKRAGSWRVALPAASVQERIRIKLDATLTIADHPGLIQCNGFYAAEHQADPFRWTGPEQTATITLPLALSIPGQLILELDSIGKNDAEGDLTISCNGTVLPHIVAAQEQKTMLTADLPASFLTGPITQIALTVSAPTTPALPDRRLLGVVFRSLTLLLETRAAAETTRLPTRAELGEPLITQAIGTAATTVENPPA